MPNVFHPLEAAPRSLRPPPSANADDESAPPLRLVRDALRADPPQLRFVRRDLRLTQL